MIIINLFTYKKKTLTIKNIVIIGGSEGGVFNIGGEIKGTLIIGGSVIYPSKSNKGTSDEPVKGEKSKIHIGNTTTNYYIN